RTLPVSGQFRYAVPCFPLLESTPSFLLHALTLSSHTVVVLPVEMIASPRSVVTPSPAVSSNTIAGSGIIGGSFVGAEGVGGSAGASTANDGGGKRIGPDGVHSWLGRFSFC